MNEQPVNQVAVEIARRKAIVDAQAALPAADKLHRENVPYRSVPRSPAINPSRMRLAEYDRQEWIVNAEPSHMIEDLVNPSYWAHMAHQMNPFDHIEVRAEDGSWVVELLVVQVERNWAKVIIKSQFELTSAENIEEPKAHEVQWKGPHRKFGVVRLSDRELIRADFKTKEEASAWLREHERVISA